MLHPSDFLLKHVWSVLEEAYMPLENSIHEERSVQAVKRISARRWRGGPGDW